MSEMRQLTKSNKKLNSNPTPPPKQAPRQSGRDKKDHRRGFIIITWTVLYLDQSIKN